MKFLGADAEIRIVVSTAQVLEIKPLARRQQSCNSKPALRSWSGGPGAQKRNLFLVSAPGSAIRNREGVCRLLEFLEEDLSDVNITELTAEVVKAFVVNNAIPASELRSLVESVHATFSKLTNAPVAQVAPAPVASPATIRESVTSDFLISLENGKKYRTLRFHLAKLGLTPEAYRQKWRLPPDYPMVAQSFAERRSALAKASGFGKSRKGKSSRGAAQAG